MAAGLIAALFAPCAGGDALAARRGQAPERRVIRISAERFLFTPSEIKLTVGDNVEFRLTSDDTAHGFRLAGTDVDIAIPKRGAGEIAVAFTADKPGRWTFECSRMCGAGHHFMRGVVIVREAGKGPGR
jgi:cytochrome c oxidase subunit 2